MSTVVVDDPYLITRHDVTSRAEVERVVACLSGALRVWERDREEGQKTLRRRGNQEARNSQGQMKG